jgi:hypothetical protein
LGTPKGRNHFENVGTDGRAVVKKVLKTQQGKMWTSFI